MTSWKSHRAKWKACTNCELADTRTQVVLAKGKLPCDVLFIGEAPGLSENITGKPFTGPAGKLLDQIIQAALPPNTRVAFTNLIACIPLDVDGHKIKEPHKEHIQACGDRLKEFAEMADPTLIVEVGGLSSKWVKKITDWEGPTVSIIHPAAILRADVSQRGLAIQQSILRIRDSYDDGS